MACPTRTGLLAAAAQLARIGPVCCVFASLWAAYPAADFGDPDALPGLRSDAADRVAGRGRPVTWPLAFRKRCAATLRSLT
jgi:hypothetical protein